MSELFIKNNRRRVAEIAPAKKTYTPEYKRLNVEPVQMNPQGYAEDFEKSSKQTHKENVQKQRDQDLINIVQKYRDGKISKEQLSQLLGTDVQEDAVIENRREQLVVSGQNEELSWLKDQPISTKETYKEEILDEEVSLPPDNEDLEVEEFSFTDVKISEYVLLHKDDLIGSGSKKKILELLNELLENSEDGDVSDFTLLKRVNLKFGLHFDD
jgi:hypothetical protein